MPGACATDAEMRTSPSRVQRHSMVVAEPARACRMVASSTWWTCSKPEEQNILAFAMTLAGEVDRSRAVAAAR